MRPEEVRIAEGTTRLIVPIVRIVGIVRVVGYALVIISLSTFR